MKETRQHLEALRDAMRSVNVDAVIVPGTDPHQSEYVSDHWKFRDWLSGFTGSNGTAVITLDKAALWTDSRYFLQAAQQLEDSGFDMVKESIPGEPTVEQWLVENLDEESVLAVDGRLFSCVEANRLERFCAENGFMFVTEFFPADSIWPDRPARPVAPAYVHDEALAGETVDSKLERVLATVEAADADAMFIASLDEIAWLFNLRGSDVEFTPVAIAFAYIKENDCNVFIDKCKVTSEVAAHFKKYDVRVRDYDDVIRFLERRSEHETVMLDPNRVSDTLANAMPCMKVYAASPIVEIKAIKNEVQIEGTRRAMERDGVALVRMFKWLEENVASGNINEVDVWTRGKQERARGENYRDDSFAMICGYKDHGAIVHYQADDESAYTLKPEGMLLVDSGGQYLDGTTDITRTITLGNPTDQEKHDYTLVLKGHLALSRVKWPAGLCGVNLDILARQPLWNEGMNFLHGTGHGVGHFLSCHEGPHSIRMQQNPAPLEPGMIVSNEPGLYKAGEYGIRTENLLLVVEAEKTQDFGDFYKFETLTLYPYDLDLMDCSMLTAEEVKQINDYHEMVRARLTPHLTPDEAQWLATKTQAL
ncbi:MAG: aminopeptidase P family protein [Bacteroidales bacterium]|nr:aminopeptidase P family protein [Candidatus Sodaliphilus fimicaballi]